MRAVRAACFAFATLVLASPALAAGPTTTDREAARSLAKRGFDLYESKDYALAIESFEKAESRIHAPPHWLYIARAQAKLGKLLAAKETYERILAEKLAGDAPLPFKEAQTSAKSELGEIDVLIPSIELTLTGAWAAKATVQLDEKPFPASALGHGYPADPGLHTFVVTIPDGTTIERTVAVKADGVTEHVNITVDAAPARVAPIVIAFTLGGLALGAGGVTMGLYRGGTPPSDSLRIASIVSFVAGGVGVSTGIVLLALRPSAPAAAPPSAKAGPQITATVGLGSIGLIGSF
jgi:hypothetical protein